MINNNNNNNNNNKGNRNGLFKLKRERIIKRLHKSAKKESFQIKINEIRKSLSDLNINGNRKIEVTS